MNGYIKTSRVLFSLIFIILFGVGTAFSSVIEGTVQGLNCVLHGELCPVDRLDAHLAAEHTFVIKTDDQYYFVPNLDRAMLSRYIAEKVRVTGKLNPAGNSVKAEKFEVFKNDEYKTTWDLEMAKEQWFKSIETGK